MPFYGAMVVQRLPWKTKIYWFIICPYFVIFITCIHGLRNMKGRLVPVVTFGIPFLSHLLWCDKVKRVVVMCHMLIGWTLACLLIRPLVFPWFRFLGHLLKLFFFFFLHFFCFFPIFYNFPSSELKSLSFPSQVWLYLPLLEFYSLFMS